MSNKQTQQFPNSPESSQPNSARVIRTYARDLAVAQGKRAPKPRTIGVTATPARAPSQSGQKMNVPAPTPPMTIPKVAPAVTPTPPLHTAPEPGPIPLIPKPPSSPTLPTKQITKDAHPGIPLGLVVTRRDPAASSGGMLPKILSTLFGVGGKTKTPVIHENIQAVENKPEEAPYITPILPTPPQSGQKMNVPAPMPKAVPVSPPLAPKSVPPVSAMTAVTQKPTVNTRTQFSAPAHTFVPPPVMTMPKAAPELPPTPKTAPVSAPPPAPTQGLESREQLLARLHARVAERGEASERLIENSVLPKAASRTPELVPVPKVMPITRPYANKPSPIHTYTSDFADRLRSTDTSEVEMLAEEQDAPRPNKRPTTQHNSHAVWFVISGIVFLIVSTVGLLYAYRYNTHLSAPVASTPTAPTLIFADSQQKLSGTGGALMQALAHSATQTLAQGSMRLTYISIATTTLSGATTTIPAAGGYLIAALSLPMPDILMRNISLNSTVGVIHAGNQTRPFFVLHVLSYDAAFAGMLRWEKTMRQDLAPLYPPYPAISAPTAATSTADTATSTVSVTTSTTTPTTVSTPAASVFIDKIIGNRDVRVLYDGAGRSILLYGFWNKQTLIIARDPSAFKEIINRLGNSNTQ